MFDLFRGLPVHVLVLHAFVVLGPIAALTAIAYVVRPRWRTSLRWPTLALAAVTAVSGLVTKESGEQLERRVFSTPDIDPAQVELIQRHTELGDIAGAIGLIFGLVVIPAVWLVLVPEAAGLAARFQSPAVRTTAAALVVVASVGLLVTVTLAGHSGASAAWELQIAQTVK